MLRQPKLSYSNVYYITNSLANMEKYRKIRQSQKNINIKIVSNTEQKTPNFIAKQQRLNPIFK